MLFTPVFGADHCLFPANSLEHFTCSKWPATLQFPAYNGRPQPFMTGAGWPCLLTPLYGAGHCLFLPTIWVWPQLIYLTTKPFPYSKRPATLQFPAYNGQS
jgi:hypothetical protein